MRVDELQQEIDELAILLKQTIDKMMPEQQRLFDEKLARKCVYFFAFFSGCLCMHK